MQALPASGAGSELRLDAPHQEAVFYFRAAQAGTVTLSVAGGWRERVPGADGGVSAGPALVPRRLPREAPASPGASSDRGPVPLGKG